MAVKKKERTFLHLKEKNSFFRNYKYNFFIKYLFKERELKIYTRNIMSVFLLIFEILIILDTVL